jgi:FolB domain-containing protein
MPDLIKLNDLRVRGRHGANPGERSKEQDFVLNVELTVDLSASSQSDVLRDTVNYSTVHKSIVQVVREKSYHLLERLAADIFEEIFQDDRIERARVSIAKPNLLSGCTPEVIIERTNPKGKAG